MRNTHTIFLLGVIAVAACTKAAANDETPKSSSAPTAPVSTASAARADQQDLQWGPAPGLPAGAEIAVLQGDPTSNQPFTIRLRFPNGYKVPPHTHPTVENVTVLSGTFLAGMGTQFDESTMQAFGRDGFASIPAEHAHYAKARGLTVVQLHAVGPFVINYVNPADAPAAR